MSMSAHALLTALAERLIPLFLDTQPDRDAARNAALEAIAAYNPQTPADYLAVGRILALSLAAIAATGKAVEPALPEKQQLQFLTKANALSRSAHQAEASLAKSRQQPPADPPPPGMTLSNQAIADMIDGYVAEYQAVMSSNPAPRAGNEAFRAALRESLAAPL